VISAGTSDIPVAEEALLTARIMGNRAEPLYDVGTWQAFIACSNIARASWRKLA